MARRTIAGSRGIVTGASSGIGRSIATELSRRGAKLVLVARRESELQARAAELGAANTTYVAGDITDAAVRSAAVEKAKRTFGGLDFLVNNAGIGALGKFEQSSPEQLRRIMEVNFFATAEMIREALPALKSGRQPIVVNVSSILGHRGIPYYTDYCASKFAVQGFSEALRAELRPAGIDLLVVSPGTVKTEFFDNAVQRDPTPWPEQPGVTPELVARRCAIAMQRGSHEIIVNHRGRMLVWLNRLSPRLADWMLSRYG